MAAPSSALRLLLTACARTAALLPRLVLGSVGVAGKTAGAVLVASLLVTGGLATLATVADSSLTASPAPDPAQPRISPLPQTVTVPRDPTQPSSARPPAGDRSGRTPDGGPVRPVAAGSTRAAAGRSPGSEPTVDPSPTPSLDPNHASTSPQPIPPVTAEPTPSVTPSAPPSPSPTEADHGRGGQGPADAGPPKRPKKPHHDNGRHLGQGGTSAPHGQAKGHAKDKALGQAKGHDAGGPKPRGQGTKHRPGQDG